VIERKVSRQVSQKVRRGKQDLLQDKSDLHLAVANGRISRQDSFLIMDSSNPDFNDLT
jgi:hypothetical protein